MGDFTRKSAKHSLVETWFKVTIYFQIKVCSFNAGNASIAFYMKHGILMCSSNDTSERNCC